MSNFEAAAESLNNFYERFGKPSFPSIESEGLAFIEKEAQMQDALPWAPSIVLEYLGDYIERGPTHIHIDHRYLGVFPKTKEGALARSQAILASYYGTAATGVQIAEAFSLKGEGGVYSIIRGYLNSYHPYNYRPDKEVPLYRKSLKKLTAPVFEPVDIQTEQIKRHQDLWVYLQRRYLPEIEEIKQSLENHKIVILDAPFGTGKTRNILNPLYLQRQKEGYVVEHVDGQEENQTELPKFIMDNMLGEFSEGKKGLFAIDEFPSMLWRYDEGTEELLSILHQRSIEVLLVNATRTQSLRNDVNNLLFIIGQRQGIDFVVHSLKNKYVPMELAQQYLRNITKAKDEVVDVVLDSENKALLVPRIFEQITECQTLHQLREKLDRLTHTSASGPSFLNSGQGGSKEDMVRALVNAGVISSPKESRLTEVADYD